MTRQCVVCESTNNLNTEMTIKLDDGSRVQVDLCDLHEDLNARQAKEAFLARQEKINALLENLKALGVNLNIGPAVQTQSGLIVPMPQPTAPTPAPAQVPQAPRQPSQSITVEELASEDDMIVDTSLVDGRVIKSVGGSTEFGTVASHSSVTTAGLKDRLPEEVLQGKVALSIVEGRSGVPIQIPTKRVDGTGVMTVRVQKTTDAELQDRFKKLGNESRQDGGADFRNGYEVRETMCPVCRGACKVKNAGKLIDCPKCGGDGFITR